jgi:salicylate hydroxylase
VNNFQCYPIFNHLPVPTYVHARRHIALLGDAAHLSQPHQGTGASQAMEDALILSSVLSDAAHIAQDRDGMLNGKILENALLAYDAVRRPRAEKIARTSREAGEMYTFKGLQKSDTKLMKIDLLHRFKWIWDIDMRKEIKEAARLFHMFEGNETPSSGESDTTTTPLQRSISVFNKLRMDMGDKLSKRSRGRSVGARYSKEC